MRIITLNRLNLAFGIASLAIIGLSGLAMFSETGERVWGELLKG